MPISLERIILPSKKEVQPIPSQGKTLFIDAIGSHAVQQAQGFISALRETRGIGELYPTIALSGAQEDTRARIAQLATPSSPKGHGFFRKVDTYTPPSVTLNNVQQTLEEMERMKRIHGDTAQVAFHFVSYERDNAETIRETLDAYKTHLPSFLHIAILGVPNEPLEKIYFEKGEDAFPPTEFGMPVLVYNKNMQHDSDRLSTDQLVQLGLAGLVANPRAYPQLNSHTYIDVLAELTEASPFIGASAAEVITPLPGKEPTLSKQDVRNDASHAIARALTPGNIITPWKTRMEDTLLDIAVCQLPLMTDDPIWKDYRYMRSIDPTYDPVYGKSSIKPVNLVISRGRMDLRESYRVAPIIAVHFFPLTPDQQVA